MRLCEDKKSIGQNPQVMLISDSNVHKPSFGSFVARLLTSNQGEIEELRPGVYLVPFHPPHPWPTPQYEQFPDLPEGLDSYGVCDSLENYMEKQGQALDALDKNFLVILTPVYRNPEGKGSREGWRWHKWGPYIGSHEIQHEYLDDEDGIDVVYCFHVYEKGDPK